MSQTSPSPLRIFQNFGLFILGLCFSLAAEAQLGFDQTELDFGLVEIGSSKTLSLNASNGSNSEPYTPEIEAIGDEFSFKYSAGSIESGKSASIEVTYAPLDNMDSYGGLTILAKSSNINDNDGLRWIKLKGTGKLAGTYYSSTRNLEQEALKAELKRIISKNYTNLGYNGARDKMYAEIDNTGGSVTCVYTGRSANFTTRSGANSNSFNCEHTWPQSLFNQKEPERADIHHLFPTDVNANSRRSNYPFGTVSSASWSEGGSKLGGGVFEPRTDHKGDVARALFYFVIRYQDYSNFLDGQETILRQWYLQDLPSSKEIGRNEAIFKYQKNRNPFVDHPLFLNRISSIGGTAKKVEKKDLCFVESEEAYQFIDAFTGNCSDSCSLYFPIRNCGNTALSDINVVSAKGIFAPFAVAKNLKPGEGHDLELRISLSDIRAHEMDSLFLYNGSTLYDMAVLNTASTGIERINSGLTQAYLNADGNVVLTTKINGTTSIKIFNGLGQVMLRSEMKSSNKILATNHFKAGIYYLQMEQNGRREIHKIFIP